MLGDAIAGYNGVKRNRRLLAGRVGDEYTIPVPVETYNGFIADLNEQQLEFERLKLEAGLVNDSRLPRTYRFRGTTYGDAETTALVAALAAIERALNDVIGEHRSRLAGLPREGTLPVSALTTTQRFLTGTGFREVSWPKDAVVRLLQTALLTPLDRPTLEEFRVRRG